MLNIRVLILIVVEDGLVLATPSSTRLVVKVLILIVVEDGLVLQVSNINGTISIRS